MLPVDWNPLDSLALLMLAVASSDAPADRAELDTITARLTALAPRSGERVEQAVRRALDHWYLQVLPGVEREPSAWIASHCATLRERHDARALRRLVQELVTVAKSSGGAKAAEIELVAGITAAFGLDELADKLVEQYRRAQLPVEDASPDAETVG